MSGEQKDVKILYTYSCCNQTRCLVLFVGFVDISTTINQQRSDVAVTKLQLKQKYGDKSKSHLYPII